MKVTSSGESLPLTPYRLGGTMDSVLALHPAALGSILGVSDGIYSLDVVEINGQQHCLVGGQCRSLIMLKKTPRVKSQVMNTALQLRIVLSIVNV